MKLDLICTYIVNGKSIDFSGSIENQDNDLVLLLSFQHKSIDDRTISKDFMYTKPMNLKVFGVNSKPYIIYDCKFYESTQKYGGEILVETMRAKFSKIIEQKEENKKYDKCHFTFSNIANLFPLEIFETKFEKNDEPLSIFKEKRNDVVFKVNDLEFKIFSFFDGISTGEKTELNIKQRCIKPY